jgi:hypothetical protein
MTVLEGVFKGWYSDTYPRYTRTFTVSNPGPEPYTETISSVMTWVARELEQIEPGLRVRITVDVIN